MIRPIRRLLTLAGRSGGRVSVIDYGEGLAIAAATHPIELVINLDAGQVDELIDVLEEWRLLAPRVASVRGLNSRPSVTHGAGEAPTPVNSLVRGASPHAYR